MTKQLIQIEERTGAMTLTNNSGRSMVDLVQTMMLITVQVGAEILGVFNRELREDGGLELREDGGIELREV